MEMIMSNPAQREWIRMQRDAEMDWRTEIRAAEKRGADRANLEVAKGLKQEGISLDIIANGSFDILKYKRLSSVIFQRLSAADGVHTTCA